MSNEVSPYLPSKKVSFSNQCILIPRNYHKDQTPQVGLTARGGDDIAKESRLYQHLLTRSQDSAEEVYGIDFATRLSTLSIGYSRCKATWSDTDLCNIQDNQSNQDQSSLYPKGIPPQHQSRNQGQEDYFTYPGSASTSRTPNNVTPSVSRRRPKGILKPRSTLPAIKTSQSYTRGGHDNPLASPTFAAPSPITPSGLPSPSAHFPSPVSPQPVPGVAAPRASYRPLKLGSDDDDSDDEQQQERRQVPRILSPRPVIATRSGTPGPASSGTLKRTDSLNVAQDSPGPAVVSNENLSINLASPLRNHISRGKRIQNSHQSAGVYQWSHGIQSFPDLSSPSWSESAISNKSPPPIAKTPCTPNNSNDTVPRLCQSPPIASPPESRSSSPVTSSKAGSTTSSGWFKRRAKRLSDGWSGSGHGAAPPSPRGVAHAATRPELKRQTSSSSNQTNDKSNPADESWQMIEDRGDSDDQEPFEAPVLVPLHSNCVCVHCDGRITAGQSAQYVPHWSRGARAKWLADRKQAEMAAANPGLAAGLRAEGLKSKLMDAGTAGEDFQNTRFNARSPPPPSSFSIDAHLSPISPVASLDHLMESNPPRRVHSPITVHSAHLLEQATRESTAEEEEAGDDLRSILQGKSQLSSAESDHCGPPAVQVDEMDQMKGETRFPAEMGSMTTAQLVHANAKQPRPLRPSSTPVDALKRNPSTSLGVPPRWHTPSPLNPSSSSPVSDHTTQTSVSSSPPPAMQAPGLMGKRQTPSPSPLSSPSFNHLSLDRWQSPPYVSSNAMPEGMPHVRQSTPLGVTEEETIPELDSSLSSQVDSVIAERQERQRLAQAKRRGGARGMMAQLEEAELAENVARSRSQSSSHGHGHGHSRSRSQSRSEDQEDFQRRSSTNLSRRHSSTHMTTTPAAPQPPIDRSSSPAIEATIQYHQNNRPSSPFMHKLKGAFRRSSSHNNQKHCHLPPPPAPPTVQTSQQHLHRRSLSYGDRQQST
ncbi:unnamed protein product [Sympodiomycopsis kandeliae]